MSSSATRWFHNYNMKTRVSASLPQAMWRGRGVARGPRPAAAAAHGIARRCSICAIQQLSCQNTSLMFVWLCVSSAGNVAGAGVAGGSRPATAAVCCVPGDVPCNAASRPGAVQPLEPRRPAARRVQLAVSPKNEITQKAEGAANRSCSTCGRRTCARMTPATAGESHKSRLKSRCQTPKGPTTPRTGAVQPLESRCLAA